MDFRWFSFNLCYSKQKPSKISFIFPAWQLRDTKSIPERQPIEFLFVFAGLRLNRLTMIKGMALLLLFHASCLLFVPLPNRKSVLNLNNHQSSAKQRAGSWEVKLQQTEHTVVNLLVICCIFEAAAALSSKTVRRRYGTNYYKTEINLSGG